MSNRIKIDIISDVVCPWCIIGYRRLEKVICEMGINDRVEIEWQPFELNPQMPNEGEEIFAHMSKKYGVTRDESNHTLANMAELGAEVGFRFDFYAGMKMVNTRNIHILLDYAKASEKQTELKLRLFEAFFSERKDVSDRKILTKELQVIGLDVDEALSSLNDDDARERILSQENYWRNLGVSSVPTMVFNRSSALNGAQPIDIYKQVLAGFIDNKEKILTRVSFSKLS
jgi:predicted DsbA family dithiol-disulfide isomerase